MRRQRGGQCLLATPALEIAQRSRHRIQIPQRPGPVRLQGFDQLRSRAREQFAKSHQFTIPEARVGPTFEGRIALAQRPAIPLPVTHEIWFHVEHRPVQPSAPLWRPLLDQTVNPWVDRLDREDLGKFGE